MNENALHLVGETPNIEWPSYDGAIYLAGPVSNIEDYNAPAFAEAKSLLLAQGYQSIINPVEMTEKHDNYYSIPRGSDSWENYMRIGVKRLIEADTLVMLPGWAQSRGAMAELILATSLGMAVYLIFPTQKLLVQTSRTRGEEKKSRH